MLLLPGRLLFVLLFWILRIKKSYFLDGHKLFIPLTGNSILGIEDKMEAEIPTSFFSV
jgi:hypothetical protein